VYIVNDKVSLLSPLLPQCKRHVMDYKHECGLGSCNGAGVAEFFLQILYRNAGLLCYNMSPMGNLLCNCLNRFLMVLSEITTHEDPNGRQNQMKPKVLREETEKISAYRRFLSHKYRILS